jgi:hypothetical protein
MKILKNTFQSIFKAKITHSQFKVHRHKTYTIYSRTLERIFFQASSLLQYFCLVLGILKSRVSKKQKTIEPLGRKPNFKLFHYKARVQPVIKITTIATRNRCYRCKNNSVQFVPHDHFKKKVPTFITNIELYGQESRKTSFVRFYY